MNNNNGRHYNVTDEQWQYRIHYSDDNNEQQYKITIKNDYNEQWQYTIKINNNEQWRTKARSNTLCTMKLNEQCTTITMQNIYKNNAQWQQ